VQDRFTQKEHAVMHCNEIVHSETAVLQIALFDEGLTGAILLGMQCS